MHRVNHKPIALTELIRIRNFHYSNPCITDDRFPIPNRIYNDYKVFSFKECVTSEKAIEQMLEEEYLPANSHELLLWKGCDENSAVAALGSDTKINGRREVLLLHGKGTGWRLFLRWWDREWEIDCHFLGVRKQKTVLNP